MFVTPYKESSLLGRTAPPPLVEPAPSVGPALFSQHNPRDHILRMSFVDNHVWVVPDNVAGMTLQEVAAEWLNCLSNTGTHYQIGLLKRLVDELGDWDAPLKLETADGKSVELKSPLDELVNISNCNSVARDCIVRMLDLGLSKATENLDFLFFAAAGSGSKYLPKAREFLARGANIDAVFDYYFDCAYDEPIESTPLTALTAAISSEDVEAVEFLLRLGARTDLSATRSALHAAYAQIGRSPLTLNECVILSKLRAGGAKFTPEDHPMSAAVLAAMIQLGENELFAECLGHPANDLAKTWKDGGVALLRVALSYFNAEAARTVINRVGVPLQVDDEDIDEYFRLNVLCYPEITEHSQMRPILKELSLIK